MDTGVQLNRLMDLISFFINIYQCLNQSVTLWLALGAMLPAAAAAAANYCCCYNSSTASACTNILLLRLNPVYSTRIMS